MTERPYPKPPYVIKRESTVLQCGRVRDKIVEVPRELPGNIILVHGVNDVGTGYAAAEAGLCAGLQDRLSRYFKPAGYTMPGTTDKDKDKVEEDPDAVYFKRHPTTDTDSPVIPFYWGFREVKDMSKTSHGQNTDRDGNRLDKDLSKGGGPFGNATSNLPDMWNHGIGTLFGYDPVGDPLRPVKDAPGRMYMVLAAQRLAALVAMIRKFEPKDTVSIVAHSQGCLLSLLAQAFLMEQGERTADTLVLTHPPYSLDDEMGTRMSMAALFTGGVDAAMNRLRYGFISERQTMQARVQTLVNIVAGVQKSKATEPVFAKINESNNGGMVASCWKPDDDRDNRGKVYLYFCPEDMTVALDNMRGIGWQGVPDIVQATLTKRQGGTGYAATHGSYGDPYTKATRKPMAEMGTSFFQRVFTAKQRLDPHTRKSGPVLVGQAPHDFALCIKGEDSRAHVARDGRDYREELPVAKWPIDRNDSIEEQRHGIRTINGERLHDPCQADIHGNETSADKIPASSRLSKVAPRDRGPCEDVNPIDAATAITASDFQSTDVQVPNPPPHVTDPNLPGQLSEHQRKQVELAYNQARNPKGTNEDNACTVVRVVRKPDGTVIATVLESPDDARRRWQHELGNKSFHSAIFESRENHRRVTAYDVAIGSGKASSHPEFYAYLCAVADWRLKKPEKNLRLRMGILSWPIFLDQFGAYYQCEPEWRMKLIEGNVDYYSKGKLPDLSLLSDKLASIVISETIEGARVGTLAPAKRKP